MFNVNMLSVIVLMSFLIKMFKVTLLCIIMLKRVTMSVALLRAITLSVKMLREGGHIRKTFFRCNLRMDLIS
jgi:hypothetical protein